jgi:hypothetical protein
LSVGEDEDTFLHAVLKASAGFPRDDALSNEGKQAIIDGVDDTCAPSIMYGEVVHYEQEER